MGEFENVDVFNLNQPDKVPFDKKKWQGIVVCEQERLLQEKRFISAPVKKATGVDDLPVKLFLLATAASATTSTHS